MISDEAVAKALAELTWNDYDDQAGATEPWSEENEEKKDIDLDNKTRENQEDESFDNICAEVKRLKQSNSLGGMNLLDAEGESRSISTTSGAFSITISELQRWERSIKNIDDRQIEAEIDAERKQAANRASTYDKRNDTNQYAT